MLGVSFNGSTNMDLAKAELRDRVERARPQLPDTVDRIAIWSHDDGDLPIMFLALLVRGSFLGSRLPDRERRSTQDRVGSRVSVRMQVWGLLDDSVRILLDEDKVKAAPSWTWGNSYADYNKTILPSPWARLRMAASVSLLRSRHALSLLRGDRGVPHRRGVAAG